MKKKEAGKGPGKRFPHIAGIIIMVLAVGVLWQNIMVSIERKEDKMPGKQIEINDHKMHIFGVGEGSPTVVFTVGSGTPCAYTDFYYIQKEIGKISRAVSYDRPGYGFSEPTKLSRDIDTQAKELHELLSRAGEKPPYVLVGHSLSSLEVMRFSQLFPKEVVGILLIDGGNPTYYESYREIEAMGLSYGLEFARVSGLSRLLGSVGILTPMAGEANRYKQLPEDVRKMDRNMFFRNLGNPTNRNEIRSMNENAKVVIKGGSLGDLPLIALTSKSDDKWDKTQKELKLWSKNCKQEDIPEVSHYIHWDRPEKVIEKIKELIRK